MNKSIHKHSIYITSLGRTGTNFFGDNLMHMIEDCISVHEPDVFYFDSMLRDKIKKFGFFGMTFGKFSFRNSIRGLNIARLSERLADNQIVTHIRDMRKNTLVDLKASVYLESSCSWSSLVDLIPVAFNNVKVAYIVRDPRTWVCSWLNNAGPRYSLLDLRSWFKNTRLTPHHIKGDSYQDRWKSMTRFEKFCWLWNVENSFALECAAKTDMVKVFRYEDLFDDRGNYEGMTKMLEFLTEFPDGCKVNWSLDRDLMRKRVNSGSKRRFPEWTAWSYDHIKILDSHCRSLMERLNYGKETEWQEILKQSVA